MIAELQPYQDAIEAMGDGIAIFDRDDQLVAFNQAYKDIYGEGVAIGVSFRQLFASAAHNRLHVNHTPQFDEWVRQRLSRDYEQLPPVEQLLSDGRWIRLTSSRLSDGGSVDVRADITTIRQREDEVSKSEERFRKMFASAATGIAVGAFDGRYLYANPAFCSIVGMSEAEVLATTFSALTHPDDRARAEAARRRLLAGEVDHFTIERRYVRPDGTIAWVRNSVASLHDNQDDEPRVVTICEDITARKEAESRLAESEARFEQIFEAAVTGIVVTDVDGNYIRANPAFCRMLGMSENELLATDVFSLTHPADLMDAISRRRQLLQGDLPHLTFKKRNIAKDGRTIWVHNSAAVIRGNDGEPLHIVTISQDITARKEAEARLQDHSSLLQIAGETAKLGGWSVDLSDRRFFWSDEACAIQDMVPGSHTSLSEVIESVPPGDRERVSRAFGACEHQGTPYDIEFRSITAMGREIWLRSVGVPVRDETGKIVRIQGSVQDITASREELERSLALAARLEATLESIGDAFFAFDRNWLFTYCNAKHEELVGRKREEMIGHCFWDVFPEHCDSEIGSRLRQAMESEKSPDPFRAFSPVSKKWLDLNVYASDEGLTVYARDVTDRILLEQQLAHSARLTSMGEMAASLAHEINQPLSVINLAAENAAMEFDAEAPDHQFVLERVNAIVEQVDKLREIIAHIRSFARKEDGIAAPFDPADAIRGALSLVSHDFQRAGIVLDSLLPDACPSVVGVPVRLEQALVNLLTNARDAVCEQAAQEPDAPRKISLECHPGEEALRISVTDTGGGMPEDVRRNVFEPFFTTKQGGKGTGLGMPIVHSIVTNMGGTIAIENVADGCRVILAIPTLQDP